MGEKNARNNFYRNTRIVRAKNVGKKSTEKVRKTVFYIRTNIVTKNGGKNAKQFFQKHKNSATKKCWEKIVEKVRKKFFLFARISCQKKWGGINARNNFSRNRQIVGAKNVGKKRRKKVRKSFL